MPQKSNIEWADFTSNPIRPKEDGKSFPGWGCTKVSPGCANCYAETMNNRFGNKRTFAGDWKFVLDEKELRRLLSSKSISGRRVFVMDMGDMFHKDVPFELIDRLFAVFALRDDVIWPVLTKRPERMAMYLSRGEEPIRSTISTMIANAYYSKYDRDIQIVSEPGALVTKWPIPNVWLGTSVEDQQRADQRIPCLLKCPAAVRFLSCEPLLGPVSLMFSDRLLLQIQREECVNYANASRIQKHIQWVIVGGESGPKARPCNIDWVRSVVKQCQDSGVPCFVKQLGTYPAIDNGEPTGQFRTSSSGKRQTAVKYTILKTIKAKADDPAEWPEDLRVRQFPNGHASEQTNRNGRSC